MIYHGSFKIAYNLTLGIQLVIVVKLIDLFYVTLAEVTPKIQTKLSCSASVNGNSKIIVNLSSSIGYSSIHKCAIARSYVAINCFWIKRSRSKISWKEQNDVL